MMTLYIYDHCPYCVKARMIFGYKNISFKLISLLNDDEESPIKMVGKKLVPILTKTDGSHMGESLDIISYIDQNFGDLYLQDTLEDANLKTWLKDSRDYLYLLAMPRWVKSPLDEFKTQTAIDYFTKKKEAYIGPFKEHSENTNTLIKKANSHLLELEKSIEPNSSHFKQTPTVNDIHLYATLRSLSIVKGVVFPKRVLFYMKAQEGLSKVPLHFDLAL